LAPTPACGDGASPTPRQTAGPYFKPRSPQRASLLEPGMAGTPLVLEGVVVRTDCAPVPRALLDFWHADDAGEYDNEGYRLRGHLFTDAAGRYRLETIVPGLYPGRTRHIHVHVQAPGERVLTTQLYFPGEPHNARDGIYSPALLVRLQAGSPARAAFDFVLPKA
ncbi:MAG TPA: intradiol ring-cleavage dioxygenase, partial [Candidatus Tectomicrobia bacterium]|nr:intradiol ring-cleavage dioxygenase [Candidatus Tectomicrobia bacterium]